MEHLANRASPERDEMIETAAYDLHRAARFHGRIGRVAVTARPLAWYIPQIAILRELLMSRAIV
jgi:hypothetical protein